MKFLAVTSQRLLFALACFATGTLPLFFLYLKAPSRLLNDYVVMGESLQTLKGSSTAEGRQPSCAGGFL